MESTLRSTHASPSPTLSAPDPTALLESARSLQRAARAGTTQPLLRGKRLGLLSDRDDGDAELFHRAAAELGAHVAHIRPSLSDLSSPQEVQHTARMLGRLYDAVECQGMAATVVRLLDADAGVPVYDGIASPRHPTAQLAGQLGDDVPEAESRRYIVQAVLLKTLGA